MTAEQDIKGKAPTPLPFFRLETIKKRPDFKAANGGARFSTPGFTMLRAPQAAQGSLRFGFTVTKKLGKAVLRNRIRRRLKAAVQAALAEIGSQLDGPPMDLVLLARSAAADLPFEVLSRDITRAVLALSKKGNKSAVKHEETPQDAKRTLGKDGPLA